MRNHDPLRLLVAANVRAELGRANARQITTANAIGMSQGALSKRLTGRIPFDVDELEHLGEYLGVPVESFFAPASRAAVSA